MPRVAQEADGKTKEAPDSPLLKEKVRGEHAPYKASAQKDQERSALSLTRASEDRDTSM